MQFDTLIIGGGLAGLSCGIRLSEQGQRCAIVSAGQSALHFSSGSFNLLNALPDGTPVDQPIEAFDALQRQAPEHPYCKLGKDKFIDLSIQAERLLTKCGINVKGNNKQNHLRLTSLGNVSPAWLTCNEMAMFPSNTGLAWRHIAVVSIAGFMDFQPELAAGMLNKQGIDAKVVLLNLPFLESLRSNASEFRSINIAQRLNQPEHFSRLLIELSQIAQQVDAIIMPACFGLNGADQQRQISETIEKPVMLVPTLPPSLAGRHIHQQLYHYFLSTGGIFMQGDSVLRAVIQGNRVTEVYSRNHTDIALSADHIVLASGSFFNKGLIAEYGRIYEPIFGLDVSYDKDRENWTKDDFFKPQTYMQFGVNTDNVLRGILDGRVIDNLYVAGAVLGGFDALKQGCGAGVSLLTALYIAEQILMKQGDVYESAA